MKTPGSSPRLPALLAALVSGAVLLSAAACAKAEPAAPAKEAQLYLSTEYDEAADPAKDLEAAIAAADGRRILVEVGGEWCVWCKILDKYLADNPDVKAAFARSFIIVKVNFSKDNQNTDFLGQYPEAEGYPQFYILDSDGSFLEAQGTSVLEEGRGYNRERMLAFAAQWLKS